MNSQHVNDKEYLQLQKKLKKVPQCIHRLKPVEIFGPGVDANPNFEPEDNLDLRNFYRYAATLHKDIRKYAREQLKPGVDMLKTCDDIEAYLRKVCGNTTAQTYNPDVKACEKHRYYCGQAFPLGLSLNNVAAHQAPLEIDNHILTENDMVKVDFGVHCNGYLIDSAFTLHWNPEYDPIVQASKEATNEAIKLAGPDANLADLGARIEEVIMSYEYNGKQLQPVRNLTGHTVDRFTVHAGKSIPLYRARDSQRMLAGEVYACETFASTGKGIIHDEEPTSHYMIDRQSASIAAKNVHKSEAAQTLFNNIRSSFNTLAWNPRWLAQLGFTNYELPLKQLVDAGHINDYPPLVEAKKVLVSQFEHTFMIGEWGIEVFSRGDDY